MSLRFKKHCLRFVSAAILFFAALRLALAVVSGSDPSDADTTFVLPKYEESDQVVTVEGQLDFEPLLSRRLQRRLFDPPPPPKQEEVKPPPPPLNVKLLGTVIDPSKSQAIIQDGRGSVSFRSLGQPVSSDFPDSTIEEILPGAIRVRRTEHVDTVKVE